MSQNLPDKVSPMMAQYQQIKSEHPDSLLLFRLGDFYELFGEDAKEASRILEITLTARSSGEGRSVKIPMCGVPHHAVDSYIARLLKAGKKVSIVDQIEDPRKAKGMVRRELVRIITPGTNLMTESLDSKQNNYLVAIAEHDQDFGLAVADFSTGEFLVAEFKGVQALSDFQIEISRLSPSEILIPDNISSEIPDRLKLITSAYITTLEGYRFDIDSGHSSLQDYFKIPSLNVFSCENMAPAIGAAAALLYYLTETQRGSLGHIKKITPYSVDTFMGLDDATIRNLELVRNLSDGARKNTLLETLDFTLTAMGSRRLRQWIIRPLLSIDQIRQRQNAVSEFITRLSFKSALADILRKMHDLERLSSRVGSKVANPRDLLALGSTLSLLPEIKSLLHDVHSELLTNIKNTLPECRQLCDLIQNAISENPPVSIKEGDIIRSGFNDEIDNLRSLSKEGKNIIAALQIKEREKTGIHSLKVEYNSVFGYYIEVSKANAKLVPEHYIRKQTLVNAERFITPELKEHEQKVLGAQDKLYLLEEELFLQIRTQISENLSEILLAGDIVAALDVLQGFAEASMHNHYICPVVDDGDDINISEGRHPVVEKLTIDKFVPNDVWLDKKDKKIIIITGPNMAGKSTFLRQTALMVIMSQIGSFIPAREAHIGIVDKVFTRVGAADNLAGGQSTFMVEMTETANILNNATKRSLVILDEVGRGTSTFDGVSIAWAVAEYLHDHVDVKTLFATHYYELTELALSKLQIKNYNIAVREWRENIIFLRKIIEGSADRSYGIQVARLAGLPQQVLERAKEVLLNLEKANYTDNGNSRLATHEAESGKPESSTFQSSLFGDQLPDNIIKELKQISTDTMTPFQALSFLIQLKEKYLR